MSDSQPRTTSAPDADLIPQASSIPGFSGMMDVSQECSGCIWMPWFTSMLGAIPGIELLHLYANSWKGILAIVVMPGGAIAGWLLGFVLLMRWEARMEYFSKKTQVTIDRTGIDIRDLGVLSWLDVLNYGGIPVDPDSDVISGVILYTRPYGSLHLRDLQGISATELFPILDFHLDSSQADNFEKAMTEAFYFKAVVFHWPRFMAWIVAGYVLSGATGLFLFSFLPNTDVLTIIGACIGFMPAAALSVWLIPLQFFSARYTKAFELRDTLLVSTDGRREVDLRAAEVRFRAAHGVGYDFSFVSIRPRRGRRLDLVMEEPELRMLRTCLKSKHLLAGYVEERSDF